MNSHEESLYDDFQEPPEPENWNKLVQRLTQVVSRVTRYNSIAGSFPLLFTLPPLNFGSFPALYFGYIKIKTIPLILSRKTEIAIKKLDYLPFRSNSGHLLTAPYILDDMIEKTPIGKTLRILTDRECLQLVLHSQHTVGTLQKKGVYIIKRPMGSIEVLFPPLKK